MSNINWTKLKKFGIRQRHRRQLSLQEAYHIVEPDSGQEILWAKRKRLGFKTDTTIYHSENMNEQNIAFIIRDNAILDSFGKFTLEVNGKPIAKYNRHFLRSLIREKWTIRNMDDEEIVTVEARSWIISLIRNLRWLPILGSFDFFIQFIRLQFDFMDRKQPKKRIGFFDRKFSIRDIYLASIEEDEEGVLDPVIALGMSILLDSAEQR